jgi:uncharacterized coiled-coil protein SlyX
MAEQNPTQETPRSDPFEIWRQLYEANEQAWTKTLKDVTTAPSYVEAQGKMLEIFLAYQKQLRDTMSSQLTAFNLPTRDDVSRLGELVIGVEEKIDKIDDAIAPLTGSLGDLSARMQSLEHQSARPGQMIGDIAEQVNQIGPLADKIEHLSGLQDRISLLAERIGHLESLVQSLSRQVGEVKTVGGNSAVSPAQTPSIPEPAAERQRAAGAGRSRAAARAGEGGE